MCSEKSLMLYIQKGGEIVKEEANLDNDDVIDVKVWVSF